MPDSFFGKLNTLVQAHINSIVDPIDEQMSKSRKKALSRQDIKGGLQKDVQVLRQRIDEALAYEGELQSKTDKLYSEIADLDVKANQAVEEGRESDARIALGRMQQAQRELEITEADLHEHRTITQELISQVNMLDSTIQAVEQDPVDDDEDISIPVKNRTSSSSPVSQPNVEEIGAQIVQQLDSTRENLSNLISDYTSKVMGDEQPRQMPEVNEPPQQSRTRPTTHPVNRDKVDDDYSARLSRLSKPDDKK